MMQMMTRTAIHPLKIAAVLGAAFLLWGLVLVYASSPAWAATITVNSTADVADGTDGECTLREAITAANTDAPSGAAQGECAAGSGGDVIDVEATGTVNLTQALPDLASNIEIEGPGADQLTVRRNVGFGFRIFTVTSVVSISGITISNGDNGNLGGGIFNNGALTVSDCTISGNSASVGGGIYNVGTLTLTGSTISDNSAVSTNGGGGGGVFSNTDLSGPKATITNSTISGNTTASFGGGVYNEDGRTDIKNSTITDNTAPDGQGSGVASFGDPFTPTEVLSTIISDNHGTDVDFVRGTTNSFVSKGYNLIGDGNATGAFNQPGDQVGKDPNLGVLAENGGPTQTHALLSGSPAIDAGPPTDGDPIACPPPATDQRGVERPQDGDANGTAACDIGAFELDPQPPELSIDNVSVTEGDSATTDATFAVSLSEASSQTVTVNFATADGTATAGTDFQSSSGTLTFAPGDTSKTVSVPIIDDIVDEPDEIFLVNLSNPTNATISDARGEGTITDDDPPPNTAPTAEADSYSTNEDTTLTANGAGSNPAGVLANDTDPDGDSLKAVLVSGPSHAATNGFTLNQDGSFSYTPASNYNGPDSFTYKADDGSATSGVATVSISVTATNDGPTVTVDAGGSCGSASDMRGTINLALLDPDTQAQDLTLKATSSNRSVLPNGNISFGGGTDASRTMTVTSLTGSGTSNVTITVSDDGELKGTVSVRVISGSASNNTLSGSANADMIFARKGSDTVSAQGANDLMCGGNGNDRLTGGLGADRFVGGSGTDTATDFNATQGDTKAGIP